MGVLRIISSSSEIFAGRDEAGRLLVHELEASCGPKAVVVGIPRGGVIIAREIAAGSGVDMDIVLSHKLGAPGNPELAIGSVSEDGKLFVDEATASYTGADEEYIEQEKRRQLEQMAGRVERWRKVLPKVSLEGREVIVTDDGVATGATMLAALWAVRQEKCSKIILALPVGPDDTVGRLSEEADETICLRVPPYFGAIGQFYADFEQVEDEQVLEILAHEQQRRCGV